MSIVTIPFRILDYITHTPCGAGELVEFAVERMGEVITVEMPDGTVLYFDGEGYLTGKEETEEDAL